MRKDSDSAGTPSTAPAEPRCEEYRRLKTNLAQNWAENRPRDVEKLKKSAKFSKALCMRAMSLWSLYCVGIDQGLSDDQAREVLRDDLCPPLEDDHPTELMDLVDSFAEWDRLCEERERALKTGGDALVEWNAKVKLMRKRKRSEV